MCGIVGAVNWGDRALLARMTDLLSHRGPDDSGLWDTRLSDGTWVGLGNRRLAILDLSAAGHMPMPDENETLWLTYNGEIYNSPALRRELADKGHIFRSRSDTEVILHLYEEEGVDCVRRLNGMFAFAVWDGRRRELFLARDPFGVKPLYYAQSGRKFAFASELKSLLALPSLSREVDPEALHRYLTFLWVPEPDTMLKPVRKLPAAHYAVYRDGELKVTRYWDLCYPPDAHAYSSSEEELTAEVEERFSSTVESQLLSDVPLGAFMSAGLDSSSILGVMARKSSGPVRTYTITFPDKFRLGERNLDDPAVASRTARHFGAVHREIVVEPDVAALLPRLIWHMDEPVADPAIIMAYLVCREAGREVTVLLSGMGGDEVFGGYRKYRASVAARWYRMLPAPLRRRVLDPFLRGVPPLYHTPLKAYAGWARKWGRSASLDPKSQFIMDATYLDASERESLCLLSNGSDPAVRHWECFARVEDADWLNQMLYVDSNVFLPSLNLNYNDKMSMAASVEVRVPFLDREFVEWAAWNVPPGLKLKGGTTKYILRRAMGGILPGEVLRQPKASFGAPIGYWLEHDLKELINDVLSEGRLKSRGWFRPSAVARILREHRAGKRDHAWQLWQFLTLELWAQAFLDGGP